MRRGVGLLHLIGGFFVAGLVLGVCVPLFLSAQRYADLGRARSRMTEQARRITHHLREDIRQAGEAEVSDGGSRLTLRLGSGETVLYRSGENGLLRRMQSASGGQEDRFAAPAAARFEREDRGVRARLFLEERVNGRRIRFTTDCFAVPRMAAP